VPFTPDWPGRETYEGTLVHSSEYTNAHAYDARDALVVGCGNSGAEIAVDLAEAGTNVRVAVRTPPAIFRRDTFGVPSQPIAIALWRLPTPIVDPIAKALRRLTIPDLSEYGLATPTAGPYSDYLKRGVVPIVDVGFVQAVKERRLEIVPTVERFDEGDVLLQDGRRLRPELIVAATGYRTGLQPLVGHLGVLDERGEPVYHAGHTHPDAPNLHFIGYTTSLGGLLRQLPGEARRIARQLTAER
jgi:putative flavoprotein involved in K+ transport